MMNTMNMLNRNIALTSRIIYSQKNSEIINREYILGTAKLTLDE